MIGVHDCRGLRQCIAGQMVVGHHHRDTVARRCGDAFDTGDAVVDRDNQIGLALGSHLDNFRAEAIAKFKAIGNQKIDIAGAQSPQAQHRQGGTRGAIAIKITDDQNVLMIGNGLLQTGNRLIQTQHGGLGQRIQPQLKGLGIGDAPGGIQLG